MNRWTKALYFVFLFKFVVVGAALLYMSWARFSGTVRFVQLAAQIQSSQSSVQSSALYFYLSFYELHAVGMVVTANIQLLLSCLQLLGTKRILARSP